MAGIGILNTPAIPYGSTVLVTGVNGLIGSHIADQLLTVGYNVRGTVRDTNKSDWMRQFFATRHASSSVSFDLARVEDMSLDGCFDHALEGCTGVIHTTASVDIRASKPEPTISNNVRTVMTCLAGAAKTQSVQRFVLTSTSWATLARKPDTPCVITSQDWNDQAVKDAYAEGTPASNSLTIFMAGKIQAEKACWEYVKNHKPHFVFNTVLPDFVFGSVLSPENQGIPSTAGFVQMLYNGHGVEFLQMVPPQHHIDTVDCARLHVAALIHPGAKDERFLGFTEPWNWNDVLVMFREWSPHRDFPEDMKVGRDLSEVHNQRSTELLKLVYGQESWTDLKTSIKNTVASFEDFESGA